MLVIGILGGIASGKSLVTDFLAQQGAATIDADAIGHSVLTDPAILVEIRQQFGDQVFTASGEVDRTRMAAIVFTETEQGKAALAKLEAITHPPIRLELTHQIEQLRREGSVKAVVLDAPLLVKAGWDTLCDQILFVDAPQEQRLQRALTRNWTEKQWAAREAAQTPIDLKRRMADHVVDNSSSKQHTYNQLEQFWNQIG
jgi:dephospho-CoA kinase